MPFSVFSSHSDCRTRNGRAYSHPRDMRDSLFFPGTPVSGSLRFFISSSFVPLPHHYVDIVSSFKLCVASLRLAPGGMH